MRRANPTQRSAATAETALYYQALTFSNVKCFQGEHIVSFCDRAGQPSLWTLLLGENGVGKTTVLQMLACMRPVPPPARRQKIEPALYGEENDSLLKLVHQDEAATTLTLRANFAEREKIGSERKAMRVQTEMVVKTAKGDPLAGANTKLADVRLGKNSTGPAPDLPIIAYWANRQIEAPKSRRSTVDRSCFDALYADHDPLRSGINSA
jgi:hypothetical protein